MFSVGLKCFHFAFVCSCWERRWCLFSGASASRGTEVLIRPQGGILEGMLKLVPQGWKGEVSWAWSLSLLVAQWDECAAARAESASDGNRRRREKEIAGF